MGHTAKAVANYVLDLSEREGVEITPLKLQKMVYIAHGWHLAIRGQPLVTDEYAEAWDHGPVFPSLYYEIREFGKKPITRRAPDLILYDDGSAKLETPGLEDADQIMGAVQIL